MTSLAAVLASPASGVSEAVTGYPIGRGDGVNSVFMVPSEITAVSTLYRRDWQGTVALSASPRTNLIINSVFSNSGGAAPTSFSQDFATGTSTPGVSDFGGAAYIQTAAAQRPYFLVNTAINVAANTIYTQSIIIESVTGTVFPRDVLGGVLPTGASISYPSCPANPLGGSHGIQTGVLLAKITIAATSGTVGFRFGLGCNGAATGTIRFSRPQLEIGSTRTGFIPTTTAPVTVTDYTLSGSTLTLAEVPARAAELTVDGTGVGIPMLRIA